MQPHHRVDVVPPTLTPLPPPTPIAPSVAPTPTPVTSRVDQATSCSCASVSNCPVIGTLSIAGLKAQPLFCNQRNGVENTGWHSSDTWFYQCTELANRWLTDSVGTRRIEGDAVEMCENANRNAFDVYAPSATPSPGDLLVWSGNRFGHVAVVQSVTPSSIVFANQNYGERGIQYPLLTVPRHTNNFGSPRNDSDLHAKCIIHPKKLGAVSQSSSAPPPNPCATVFGASNGEYCGASRQNNFTGGAPSALYTCRNGAVTTISQCANRCIQEAPGKADHCS